MVFELNNVSLELNNVSLEYWIDDYYNSYFYPICKISYGTVFQPAEDCNFIVIFWISILL